MRELRQVPIEDVVGRVVRSETQVGFTQCDPYGHMNTAAFLAVAIDHRMTEVLQLIGLDTMRQRKEQGITWLIRRVEMDLMEPADHADWLYVDSWIDDVAASRMIVKVHMTKQDSGKSACLVTFTAMTMNVEKGVLVQIPSSFPCSLEGGWESLPWADGHPRTG